MTWFRMRFDGGLGELADAPLHRMVGGMPPELAWHYLELLQAMSPSAETS